MKIYRLLSPTRNRHPHPQEAHSRIKPRVNHWAAPVLLLFAVALTACGGGGGDTPAVATGPGPAVLTLNDTGQTACYDNTPLPAGPQVVNCADVSIAPGQDGLFGRDAQAVALILIKVGSGAAGFDFTKVCMDGTLNCAGAPSNAAAPAATEWACTKDNHTNLIWSLEIQSANWADARDEVSMNGLPANANIANRCGFNTGWRLPTRLELLSIVYSGRSLPAIDVDKFPGTGVIAAFYWINGLDARDPANAWYVNFNDGSSDTFPKTIFNGVMLVRSGQ